MGKIADALERATKSSQRNFKGSDVVGKAELSFLNINNDEDIDTLPQESSEIPSANMIDQNMPDIGDDLPPVEQAATPPKAVKTSIEPSNNTEFDQSAVSKESSPMSAARFRQEVPHLYAKSQTLPANKVGRTARKAVKVSPQGWIPTRTRAFPD